MDAMQRARMRAEGHHFRHDFDVGERALTVDDVPEGVGVGDTVDITGTDWVLTCRVVGVVDAHRVAVVPKLLRHHSVMT